MCTQKWADLCLIATVYLHRNLGIKCVTYMCINLAQILMLQQ